MSITRQVTIWCDGCGNWDQASTTASRLRKELKTKGWSVTSRKNMVKRLLSSLRSDSGTEEEVRAVIVDILGREMTVVPQLTSGRWKLVLPGENVIEFVVKDGRIADAVHAQCMVRDEQGTRVVKCQSRNGWVKTIPRTTDGMVEWAYSRFCEPRWEKLV